MAGEAELLLDGPSEKPVGRDDEQSERPRAVRGLDKQMAVNDKTALVILAPGAEEMDAYERVLGDAMAGDATLFAREYYVEEAWRIVDLALNAGTPVYEYEPSTWGPSDVDQKVSPPGGWHNPMVSS